MPSVDRKDFNSFNCYEKAVVRGIVYSFLSNIFGSVPNKDLVNKLKSEEFENLILLFKESKIKDLSIGADLLVEFNKLEEDHDDVLLAISIERTKICRGIDNKGPKPPYETLYKENSRSDNVSLGVKKFYRKNGYIPSDSSNEMSDYIGLELDFMRNLIEEELELRSKSKNVNMLLKNQCFFLKEHLGSWIKNYINEAEKFTKTLFFKGFLSFLHGFVIQDLIFLEESQVNNDMKIIN